MKAKATAQLRQALKDRSDLEELGAAARQAPRPPVESEAPRDRQRAPVPAMFIPRSFPLWSGNQQRV
ncbi:hypothetical protein AM500_14035 [Bacillus sp. FJAT-18017]|nr:hypothetical protein AM500_14035 [Bacillus sp. FJAT-18017]